MQALRSHLRVAFDFVRLGTDYWLTIYPRVTVELRRWRTRAAAIPDPTLRAQALGALREKRRHSEGAAAFAILAPRSRRAGLIRFLVAFQAMYDYLDTISESGDGNPFADTLQLHTALTDALMPGVAHSHAYALHPQDDDGGYLAAFLEVCREACLTLPAFPLVSPLVREAAKAARESQGYNHALPSAPPGFLSEAVEPWAARHGGTANGLTWWEVIGATGSSLAILAQVAAAADPRLQPRERDAIKEVYAPWASAVLALVDSLVDQARDNDDDTHNLVARYGSQQRAAERVASFANRALDRAGRTRQPDRHGLIVATMIALFATSPDARAPCAQEAIRCALAAAGPRGVLPYIALRLHRRLSDGRSPPAAGGDG
jgi:tetraprenyl-beta-curcumene synthase